MTKRTTESGILYTLQVWVPASTKDLDGMSRATNAIQNISIASWNAAADEAKTIGARVLSEDKRYIHRMTVPAPSPDEELRKAVAEAINPWAWKEIDGITPGVCSDQLDEQKDSLYQADAAIALTRTATAQAQLADATGNSLMHWRAFKWLRQWWLHQGVEI